LGKLLKKRGAPRESFIFSTFRRKYFASIYIYYIYKLNSPSGTPRIVSRTIIAIIKYHIFIKKTTGLVDK